MGAMVFPSDAGCCATCQHAVDGAEIDGIRFDGGWRCEVNDVAGAHGKEREALAICRVPELWEEAG